VSDEAADDAELVSALLSWDPAIDVDAPAEAAGIGARRVRDALTQLGTAGRVGYAWPRRATSIAPCRTRLRWWSG
jgi:hypothetical protein